MKALSNWEKKSQWLLTEIVKYDSYIDSLQAAMALRLKKRGEKGVSAHHLPIRSNFTDPRYITPALERALNGVNPLDDRQTKGKYSGPDDETIDEEVEPLTPGPIQNFPTDARSVHSHYD